MLTEVAVEVENPDIFRIFPVKFRKDLEGGIPASVVHENDFVRAVHSIERLQEARTEMGKRLLLVIDRNDDGYGAFFGHCASTSPFGVFAPESASIHKGNKKESLL
jgi:hypothetical protein